MTDEVRSRSRQGVRTPARPMTFTFAEFARGAGIAVASFFTLFAVAMWILLLATSSQIDPSPASWAVLLPWTAVIASIFAAPPVIAGVVVGGAVAYLAGTLLSRVRSWVAHLAVYAVIGALVGLGGTRVETLIVPPLDTFPAIDIVSVACTTAAVAFGWWRTSRRALASDALATPDPET